MMLQAVQGILSWLEKLGSLAWSNAAYSFNLPLITNISAGRLPVPFTHYGLARLAAQTLCALGFPST